MAIHVAFTINPLGRLKVEWSIPTSLIQNINDFCIEVPGFKYDLPTFATIPVPFSSKAFHLKVENVKASNKLINYTIEQTEYGNSKINFAFLNKEFEENSLSISYEIPDIMNSDGIYFVVVYPFIPPFLITSYRIDLKAKFSYNIRIYRFWERYFSHPSGQRLERKKRLVEKKVGDELLVQGDIELKQNEVVDLHLTGTRFPFLIRRDKFWLVIFIIFLLITLSPYLLLLISIFFNSGKP